MPESLKVPRWLARRVEHYRKLLQIPDSHTIELEIERTVRGIANVEAEVYNEPDINYSIITFRSNVADTAEWHTTIIHELIHIKHCRIDQLIRCDILEDLPAAAQPLAERTYRHAYEAFVDDMAKAIYSLSKG